MTRLHRDAVVQISPADLCSILGELICKDYSLFQDMAVATIEQRRDGNFDVALVVKVKANLVGIVKDKPGGQTVSDMVQS